MRSSERSLTAAKVFVRLAPACSGHADRPLSRGSPEGSRAATGRWISEKNISETYLERARGLNAIARERGQTLAQLALSWVLRHPEVTSALIGASSVAQLESSLAAVNGPPLTEQELAAIEPFAVDGTGSHA